MKQVMDNLARGIVRRSESDVDDQFYSNVGCNNRRASRRIDWRNALRLLRPTVLLLVYFFANNVHAAGTDSRRLWFTLETDHFFIHYTQESTAIAERAARLGEAIHTKLSPLIKWEPEEKTHVTLVDQIDVTNGFATPLPYNTIQIWTSPPHQINSLEDYDDWLYRIFLHEYTHVLHLDKVSSAPRALRHVIGKNVLYYFFTTTPNLFSPRWFTEGLATQMETDLEGGIGRGQSSYFRALMRMEAQSGLKSLRAVNQSLYTWPMGTSWYLYGVYFQQFLARKYGFQIEQRFLDRYSRQLIPFMLNSAMIGAIGKDFFELWDEFVLDTEFKFTEEASVIRKQGVAIGESVTNDGYDTGFSRADEHGGVFYIVNDLDDTPTLYHLASDVSNPTIIAKVEDSYFDYHPKRGLLLTEFDVEYNVNIYSDLYSLDPKTGNRERMTRNARVLHAKWSTSGDTIAAVTLAGGRQELVLLDAHAQRLRSLSSPQDNVMYNSLDFSADDRVVLASVFRPDAGWNLELLDLESGLWQRLTQNEAIEANARFVPGSSREIVFTADYDGVYNIYRYNIETHALRKLTHVLGGAFEPSLSVDGKTLYYRGLNINGFDLYRLDLSTPQPTQSAVATYQLVNTAYHLKSNFTEPGPVRVIYSEYQASRYIRPTFWYPILLLAEDRTELQLSTGAVDPLQYHSINGSVTYDFTNSLLGWQAIYSYSRYRPLFSIESSKRYHYYYWSNDPKLGPAVIVGENTLQLLGSVPFFHRTWNFSLFGGAVQQNTTVEYTDPPASIKPLDETLVGGGFHAGNTRSTPRAVAPLRGFRWRVVADEDVVSSLYQGTAAYQELDLYTPPMKHTVAHAYFAAGGGQTSIIPFRFESLDSSLLSEPLIGKRDFVLRGYPSGHPSLEGNRFVLGKLDWNFPLATPETGFMMPPIGLSRINGTLFGEAGTAWDSRHPRPTPSRAVGAELVFETTLGYLVPLDMRLGYAKGLDEFGEEQTYLTIKLSL